MKTNISDGPQVVTLVEQAKVFCLHALYPPPRSPLRQRVNGAVHRMFAA